MNDFLLPGGYRVEAERLRHQRIEAQRIGHSSCLFQNWTVADQLVVVTVYDLYDAEYPTLSVTNDAEYVTHNAYNFASKNCPNCPVLIIYRDTDGQWDELRHREGYFACFRVMREQSVEIAIDKVCATYYSENKGVVN